jgi:hypothetical protein
MDCEKFEQLIALYIEGDLPEREIAGVELHIAACQSCSQFVEDLQESQLALKAYGLLDLNEATLGNMRRSVLNSIGAQTNGSTFWKRFFNFRYWRYAFASLIIGALALSALFYFQRSTTKIPQIADKSPLQPSAPASKPPAEPKIEVAQKLLNQATSHTKSYRPFINRKTASDNVGIKKEMQVKLPEVEVEAEEVMGRVAGVLASAGIGDESQDEASDWGEKKIKVELQTKDPKIRIIWFLDKENGKSSS